MPRTIITTTYTERTSPTTSWENRTQRFYLLTEVFDFLLQENWWKLQLEKTWTPITNWN